MEISEFFLSKKSVLGGEIFYIFEIWIGVFRNADKNETSILWISFD